MNLRSREITIMQIEDNKQGTEPRLSDTNSSFNHCYAALMTVKSNLVHNFQQVKKILSETITSPVPNKVVQIDQ